MSVLRKPSVTLLPKFAVFLVREGVMEESELEALEADVDREIIEATDKALVAEVPSRGFDL